MRAHGFSLVEVLVAVCVLACGALGALSTQAVARKGNTDAILTARATALAASLAAHIEAEGASAYLGTDYDAASGPPAIPAGLCEAADCAPDAMAQSALFHAESNLHERFPGGRLVICTDGVVADPVTSDYVWTCDAAAGAPTVIKIGWAGAPRPAVFRMVMPS